MPEISPDARRPFEQLRDRVMTAARELERLREENARLSERITALEGGEAAGAGGASLARALDDDPEHLRASIESFIAAIDRVLAGDLAEDAERAGPAEDAS